MSRVSKVFFYPSLSLIASACFLLVGTNTYALTQNLSGAGSTNQANSQQQQAAQQRQEQIRQQQLQMQQQLAQARQAEQARVEQARQQQLQYQQQLAQARQAEQARQEQIRQQQLQMQQQLAQVRQQQALKTQQAQQSQQYQAQTGAGSTAQMSSQVQQQMAIAQQQAQQRQAQQKIDQQRQLEQLAKNIERQNNQSAIDRLHQEALYKKNPTESPTYKIIEKATPVVGAIRDTAAAVTIGLAQQLITGEKSYINGATINSMRSAEIRAVEKKIENKAINNTITNAQKTNQPVNGGVYRPPESLPRDLNGNPIPTGNSSHTQIGTQNGSKGPYTQARTWEAGNNGIVAVKKDIDFTNHGRPEMHTDPHQHVYSQNKTGGTPSRGKAEPFN